MEAHHAVLTVGISVTVALALSQEVRRICADVLQGHAESLVDGCRRGRWQECRWLRCCLHGWWRGGTVLFPDAVVVIVRVGVPRTSGDATSRLPLEAHHAVHAVGIGIAVALALTQVIRQIYNELQGHAEALVDGCRRGRWRECRWLGCF